ncbi:WD40-repeat-containing domain [Pseudocohnilembus persalinus]|uniref:WD40-repeat-containing domain n=1 Tax=Pseudocohnilembus persalinus TaxID=266149 RepID=A0A0V0R0E0_PSEPJ|nr:WD40-repeat-containing domain [Pseudocohnilembus persalinus]|eukprot:KRX07776.1 WD40-repeat-containing domain [Pseudocohnilembus persalinus]
MDLVSFSSEYRVNNKNFNPQYFNSNQDSEIKKSNLIQSIPYYQDFQVQGQGQLKRYEKEIYQIIRVFQQLLLWQEFGIEKGTDKSEEQNNYDYKQIQQSSDMENFFTFIDYFMGIKKIKDIQNQKQKEQIQQLLNKAEWFGKDSYNGIQDNDRNSSLNQLVNSPFFLKLFMFYLPEYAKKLDILENNEKQQEGKKENQQSNFFENLFFYDCQELKNDPSFIIKQQNYLEQQKKFVGKKNLHNLKRELLQEYDIIKGYIENQILLKIQGLQKPLIDEINKLRRFQFKQEYDQKYYLGPIIQEQMLQEFSEIVNLSSNIATLYNQLNLSFANQDLSNTIIKGAILPHAQFEYSNLTNCNLQECFLEGADFNHAILKKTNFQGVNFNQSTDLKDHTSEISCLKFSQYNPNLLLTAGKEGMTYIWNVMDRKQIYEVYNQDSWVSCADFNKSNTILALGYNNGNFQIIETPNNKKQTVNAHQRKEQFFIFFLDINYLQFSYDDSTFISASQDQSIKLWHLNQKQSTLTIKDAHKYYVYCVKFDSSFSYILSSGGDELLKKWDLQGNLLFQWSIQQNDQPVTCFDLSCDGRYQVYPNYKNYQHIIIKNMYNQPNLKNKEGHRNIVLLVRIFPDSNYIASCDRDNHIKIWEIFTGEMVRILKGPTKQITQIEIDQTNQYITASSMDGSLTKWQNAKKIVLKQSIGYHLGPIKCLVFSQCGQFLASGSQDNNITIWDIENNSFVRTIYGHSEYIEDLVFRNDSKYMISAGGDRSLKIWDIQKGCFENMILKDGDGKVLSISLSPNNDFLVSCDKNVIRVWKYEKERNTSCYYKLYRKIFYSKGINYKNVKINNLYGLSNINNIIFHEKKYNQFDNDDNEDNEADLDDLQDIIN